MSKEKDNYEINGISKKDFIEMVENEEEILGKFFKRKVANDSELIVNIADTAVKLYENKLNFKG